MNNEKKEEITDVQINSIQSSTKEYKIKSIFKFSLLIIVLLAIIMIMGRYLPEFFVLIVFLLILSMPVIILLRKKLYGIVPDFVKDSFLEIDQQIENKNKQKKNYVTRFYKQIVLIIFVFFLFAGGLYNLLAFNREFENKKSITKFLGAFVCIVISGIAATELSNI